MQDEASKILAGHSSSVNQAIFHPDGRLVSCSGDDMVKVWDTESGKELFTLEGHTDWISTIAMLPNGWLASGSEDTTIKLWDLNERKEVRTLQGHTRSIVSLKVLSNGNLVSCSEDDTLKTWNPYLTENNLLLTIEEHGNTSGELVPIGVLSNDFFVACSSDESYKESTLRVWDSKDGRLVHTLSTGLKAVRAVLVLSNDQVAIGAVGWNGAIKVIDLNGQPKSRTKENAHELDVYCLLELSNGNLVSAGQDGYSSSYKQTIKVWSFADLALLQYIKTDHCDWIYSLSWSRDEAMLASGSGDMTIKLWPISTEGARSSSQPTSEKLEHELLRKTSV